MNNKAKAKTSPKRKHGLFVLLLSIIMGLAFPSILSLGAMSYWVAQEIDAQGPITPSGEDRYITIERGQGAASIAAELEREGVIRDHIFFRIAAKLHGAEQSFQAGEYAFASGISINAVIAKLREGDVVLHTITIPEGLTSAMIVERLNASPLLTGEIAHIPEEGRLLPDTYHITREQSRQALITRMQQAQDALIEEIWAKRQSNLPLKSAQEAIILASIVEKETGTAEERPLVASVFINRLNRPMRLESDPTIIYGISEGVPLGRGLRRSEIDRPTPYNTYQIDGLPPTPICNPGADAIRAVLNPPQTPYLFFVADGTGGHAFASTYSNHQRNVRAWRRIEHKRKGR